MICQGDNEPPPAKKLLCRKLRNVTFTVYRQEVVGLSIGSESMISQGNMITDRIRKNFALPIAAGGSFVTHHKTLSKTCLDVDLLEPTPEEMRDLLKVN